jgi:hypothetical protein
MLNNIDGKTKITVKVYEPLFLSFEKQLKHCFIKRDEFLNQVIRFETPYLASELNGLKQSQTARRHIAGKLKQLGTRTVNVVVEKSTADALNEVVEKTNLGRDAFINRLILLLTSPDPIIEYLNLPKVLHDEAYRHFIPKPMSTLPLLAMRTILEDPLYYLRLAAEERLGCGLYRMELPTIYDGLACYLPDMDIPGAGTYVQPRDRFAYIFKELLATQNDGDFFQSLSEQENTK